MDWLYQHFGSMEPAVLGIFFGILAAGFLAYVAWASPCLRASSIALERLAGRIRATERSSEGDAALADEIRSQDWLQAPWTATVSRVLHVGRGENRKGVLLGTVADLWQPERLLHKRMNIALFEAAPNIAVGVGLFFTFLFLTLALTDATAALGSGGVADPVRATSKLLSSAGGKFLSSLAGLFVSLAWTFAGKRAMAQVDRACVHVVDAIEARWPPVGAEAAVVEQLSHLLAVENGLNKQQETVEQHAGLTEEILIEAREQTGVLKRFETDLAISIGKAVTAGFSPQMEAMTARLETSISALSERMGTMNEDALRTMMEEFSQAISANTAEEMAQFKATLTNLSQRLDQAGGELNAQVGAAAKELGTATGEMSAGLAATAKRMSDDIGAAAERLAASVAGMNAVIDKASSSVREIDATLHHAATLGAQGASRMEQALDGAGRLVSGMGDAASGWDRVNGDLKAMVATLVEATDGIDELTAEQRAVARALQSAGPEVLAAVEKMREELEATVRSVASSMGQVQDSMGHTSQDLTSVVNAIRDGVVQYSQQLARLHQAMDSEMSKAVSKLGGAIQSLDESIGELNDGLDDLSKRR